MSRITAIDPANTTGKTKDNLAVVEKLLGGVPNLFRVAANSPAAIDALVGIVGATAKGTLGARTREAIALVVAEANGCDYCLSAHTLLGKNAGLSDDDLNAARDAASRDPKTAALLRFAREVVLQRGRVGAHALEQVRAAGATDAEVMEVIANVVVNTFTNMINLVADTDIDFPVVRAR